MEINFPKLGLDEGVAAKEQPPLTSPSLRNVRPHDTEEDRIRGGQRPALVKAYTTRVVGDNPVILIGEIATTYVDPA